MSEQLVNALISATVALVISLIGLISGNISLRAKKQELERQISNKYQERLYEKRLELYPSAFIIAKGITYPPKAWASFKRSEMLDKRDALLEWVNSQAGLIISREVIKATRELIRALSPDYGDSAGYQRSQMENIIDAAAAFRRELRRDLRTFHLSDSSRYIDDA